MAEQALYVLAEYDDQTERTLAALQDRLYELGFSGTQTRDIFMHITLGSFPVEKEEEVKELVKQAAQSGGAFDVTLNHVGIFGGQETNVLFIAPDINRELLALKERFGGSFGWTAHTTLLIDRPEVIHRAVPAVLERFSVFTGRVTALHLYAFWPSRHILSVRLGGAADKNEKEE